MSNIDIEGIGDRINRLRKAQNITIRELSEYTGYSMGFLSNIETGKTVPNVESLQRIAEVLQTDIVDLLTEESPKRFIMRRGEGSIREIPENNMTIEKLDFGFGKQVYEILTIEPFAAEKGALSRHLFPEVCTVIEGSLNIEINGKEYLLKEGDSVYVQERAEHRIYNLSKKRSVSYWVLQK